MFLGHKRNVTEPYHEYKKIAFIFILWILLIYFQGREKKSRKCRPSILPIDCRTKVETPVCLQLLLPSFYGVGNKKERKKERICPMLNFIQNCSTTFNFSVGVIKPGPL